MLLHRRDKFLIPASLVATVNVENNLAHAFLVLTKNRYAKIIVVDNDNYYCGQISLAMITEQLLDTEEINVDKLNTLKVGDVMQTATPVIHDPFNIEENLHLLVDHSFLTVTDLSGHFEGIVTRREVLKAVNYMAHEFGKQYNIENK